MIFNCRCLRGWLSVSRLTFLLASSEQETGFETAKSTGFLFSCRLLLGRGRLLLCCRCIRCDLLNQWPLRLSCSRLGLIVRWCDPRYILLLLLCRWLFRHQSDEFTIVLFSCTALPLLFLRLIRHYLSGHILERRWHIIVGV